MINSTSYVKYKWFYAQRGAVDDTGEFWGFVAEGKKGKKTVKKVVFVNCDPEGNGPGFLEIEDG